MAVVIAKRESGKPFPFRLNASSPASWPSRSELQKLTAYTIYPKKKPNSTRHNTKIRKFRTDATAVNGNSLALLQIHPAARERLARFCCTFLHPPAAPHPFLHPRSRLHPLLISLSALIFHSCASVRSCVSINPLLQQMQQVSQVGINFLLLFFFFLLGT